MGNSVLVIGNGFDIAHSLKTSYNDFIDSAMEYAEKTDSNNTYENKYIYLCQNNGFMKAFIKRGKIEKWVDVEKEIKIIVEKIEEFMSDDYEVIGINGKYRISINDIFLRERLLDFGILDATEYQETGQLYFESQFFDKEYNINRKAIVSKMEEELNGLINCFEIYLMHIMPEIRIKPIEQIKKIDPAYIISFNYTDTYVKYNFDLIDAFHIHGKIGMNNIVLGMDDDDEDKLEFVSFKKYFQRIEKKTGFLNEEAFVMEKDAHNGVDIKRDVYFYGHSLDITDADTIEQIKNLSETMYIFYRENEDDYKNQVKNLIAIFGKRNTIDMVQKGKIVFKKVT